jgi:exodeoxyribonuclease III
MHVRIGLDVAFLAQEAPLLALRAGGYAPEVPLAALTVLTLNVQHAGPARARALVKWISEAISPDVVVLTEVGIGQGRRTLLDELSVARFATLVAAPADCPDYSVIVASRLGHARLHDARPVVLPHRLGAIRLLMPASALIVVGIYVPSRGAGPVRNLAKRTFQDAAARLLRDLLGGIESAGVIVAGDFNVIEPSHVPAYRVFQSWEYDFYNGMNGMGLVDAFRLLHPDDMSYSWYGASGRNGYRFDHAFITATHSYRVTDCKYLDFPRLTGLSDHSALILCSHW